MNQSEKRRRELLESAKDLYSDRRIPPAVHPRYRNSYARLYGEEQTSSGLGLRIMISCLIFAVFVLMDYQEIQIAQVDSTKVVQVIEEAFDMPDTWN